MGLVRLSAKWCAMQTRLPFLAHATAFESLNCLAPQRPAPSIHLHPAAGLEVSRHFTAPNRSWTLFLCIPCVYSFGFCCFALFLFSAGLSVSMQLWLDDDR